MWRMGRLVGGVRILDRGQWRVDPHGCRYCYCVRCCVRSQ